MFDFIFGPSLILAITFAQGSDISETALSFPDDALVCLRAPYEACETDDRKGISEDQLALDVETDTASESFVFSKQIIEIGMDQTRSVMLIGKCAQVSAGTPVLFEKSK